MNFPSFYLGALSSSKGSGAQNLLFYTASSSPMQSDFGSDSIDHEFEFKITSRMITNRCEFQQTYPTFWWKKRNNHELQKYRLPARAKSFCSGQVLPLKPPPRLQTLVSSSPRSPNSLLRIPFSRPCTWNDDFDPFQFALEKVSDETRARMSFHRRSHSYSAYRTSGVAHWLDDSVDRNKENHKHEFKPDSCSSKIVKHGLPMKPNGHIKSRGPTLEESVYSRRFVPNDPVSKPRTKPNPMVRTTTKSMSLRTRLKDTDHEPMKARSDSSCSTESKMQRVISFLFNLRKGRNETKISWKLRRCLGYAPGSPPFMNERGLLSGKELEWVLRKGCVLFGTQRWVKLFNIYPRKGAILAGSDADIIIFNPNSTFHISAKTHHSRSDTNVYEGRSGKGKVEVTIAGGRIVWENEELNVVPGSGKYISMPPFNYLYHGNDKADANYFTSLKASGNRIKPSL